MNLRNILYLSSFVLSLGCVNANNPKRDTEKKNNDKNQVSNVPTNVDLKFETFIERFSKDSLFQISRINFPLKVKELDDEDEKEITIHQSNFHHLDFIDTSAEHRSVDKYKRLIKVTGNKAVIETRGIDNGIYINTYFEKINGLWILVTWVDSST